MFGTFTIEQLIKELKSQDKEHQWKAAHILVELGGFVINDLIKMLEHANDDLSCPIAAIIIQIGSPAVPALEKALAEKPNPRSLRMIIEILSQIGDRRSVHILVEMLASENRSLHKIALDALTDVSARQLKPFSKPNQAIHAL